MPSTTWPSSERSTAMEAYGPTFRRPTACPTTPLGYGTCTVTIPITSAKISNGIRAFGEYAFYKCAELREVMLPNNITDISQSAFYGCSDLTSINIPSGA